MGQGIAVGNRVSGFPGGYWRRPPARGRGVRPYAPPVGPRARIPDYDQFCRVAEEHAACWEVTYEFEATVPYQARHRQAGYRVAASDLEMFAHLLRVTEAPAYVRPYVDSQAPTTATSQATTKYPRESASSPGAWTPTG